MKIITFISKTHGAHTIQLDDKDFDRVQASGKWCVVIKRGNPYFQKRIDWDKETKSSRIVELHRWLMGEPKNKYVDHINGNTLDNRQSNLRICTNAANIRNGKIRKNNTSGATGVRQPRGKDTKWEARIRVNYEIFILGFFDTFQEAKQARREAEKRYFHV